MTERRRRSIPAWTSLDAYRGQKGMSIGVGSLTPDMSGQGSSRQNSEGFDFKRHVFQKPTKKNPIEPFVALENKRITWQVETIADYNNAGDLGLIVQFSGINFADTPNFEKSRQDYGPNSSVFYAQMRHKNNLAFLILSTLGDIFECQIVPKAIDVNPFFREEIYYPPLLTLYDPTSMSPTYNNGLTIVSYKARNSH